jgi:hypothetical protein
MQFLITALLDAGFGICYAVRNLLGKHAQLPAFVLFV